ncbi:MAG TPA: hypothetical protein VEB86_17355 [Chryseosolibacter sp.]|nr:hypothetical protein [Chryseosolibacter sp.]
MTNIHFYNSFRFFALVFCSLSIVLFSGCDEDDPRRENTPELITKATLIFTPAAGGSVVQATATDPDGEGVDDLTVDGPINLEPFTTYTLQINLINELAQPTDPAYDITGEVEEEGDEHLFLYAWTNNVFADPSGDGNIDARADDVNYLDEDEGGLPIGLETSWTTGTTASGTFRVILKHQPDLKSETSASTVGETDLDIQFVINIQ